MLTDLESSDQENESGAEGSIEIAPSGLALSIGRLKVTVNGWVGTTSVHGLHYGT